jgi:UDP-N-acetylmuramoylalanine--D-glutamate ligase
MTPSRHNTDPHAMDLCATLGRKRVVVMGLGRFGGGVGVARYLATRGVDVLVTDLLGADSLANSLAKLDGLPIRYSLGGHNVRDFTQADLVVVNPAVDPRNNPYLTTALEAGVALTSEIRLLAGALPTRTKTIGVTGTAGKSTVTAMIGHILDSGPGRGRVHIGGNLGGSLLDRIDTITADDWVVLELSSFMLEGLALDGWSPHIAVLTNLSENHLDRHGSWDAYVAAKASIFQHQQPEDYAVLLREDASRFDLSRLPGEQTSLLADDVPEANLDVDLLIPGAHNRMNAAMACTAARFVGVAWGDAQRAVASFAGLPHRMQLVCEHGDVRYYDDSKSTTPQAAMLAIGCFAPSPDQASRGEAGGGTHVILGGYDKGSALNELGRFAGANCTGVYTIGATGNR